MELKDIAKKQKKRLYFLYFSSIIISLSIVAQAYFIVVIVDKVFLQRDNFQQVLPSIGFLFIFLLMRVVFQYLNGRTGIKMGEKAKKEYRKKLIKKYVRNPIQGALRGQSGQKVAILLDTVDEIDSYFSKYYPQMVQTSVVPIIILIAIFLENWVSALILIITSPFIPVFMAIIGKATQKKSEEQMDKLAAFSGRFLDILQGITTLKLFGKSKEQQDVIGESSRAYGKATMNVLKTAFISTLMLELVSMLSIGLVAIEVGFRLVLYEQLTFFTAFFVLILVPEFFQSLKDLGSAFHSGKGSLGAANRLIDELNEEENFVPWGEKEIAKRQNPPSIQLEKLTFSYGQGKFKLHGMDVALDPYSSTAIIGKSGSGKTTILHLLSGLVAPQSGRILVNGHDLASYKEKEWMDQLSYISQDPYLFSGNFAENIALGVDKDVRQEDIELAAKKAGISDLIESLKDGYETRVGEGGRGLSGGEKQRVALARAFLKKPKVILFDEPTVGLDVETERILQRSIKELSKDATIITVAHRLHTIMDADQILILQDGSLIGKGTHEDLMNESREYRDMVEAHEGGTAS